MRGTDMADTPPDVQALLVRHWRQLSIADRVAQIEQMHEDVERIAVGGIRRQHPGISDAELRVELVRRRYGDELARSFRAHLGS